MTGIHTTKIEWTHMPGRKGETLNPILGCLPISPGCANCYAARQASRGLCKQHKGLAEGGHWTGEVRWVDRVLEKIGHWRAPRLVFLGSMSDFFYDRVPDAWLNRIMWWVKANPQHLFILLTKRPERMRNYLLDYYCLERGLLQNLLLGVTAENQDAFNERVPILLDIPAAVRFVSIEPMLGPVLMDCDSAPYLYYNDFYDDGAPIYKGPSLTICGGETGPSARPMDPEWARSLRDQCAEAGVPFFMKKLSGGAEPPEDLLVRQWWGEA